MTTVASNRQNSNPEAIESGAAVAMAARLLEHVGVPPSHAHEVAEALVAADLEGLGSHGLMLLPMYLDRLVAGSVSAHGTGRLVSQNAGAAVYDAENALGQITSQSAVQLAIALAREHATGTVAVRNGFHFGTAGRWASQIARAGCIGIALSNTRPLMPAPGGSERLVGNNPLAIAMPTKGEEPLVVDFALSEVAMGKIRLAEASGASIPLGWASDSSGQPTTDPAAAIKGMLLPAAGPKGFGLAMMIDLIAGGLSSGAVGSKVQPLYGDLKQPYACAHFFMAIDVAAYRPVADLAAVADGFAETIRASKPAPGVPRVMAPGDPAIEKRRSAGGTITLEPSTLANLRKSADKLGVQFTL